MRNGGLVSVIMPAFNAGEYIEEAILSVLNQTYVNWELLIINDGSTDNTAEIIQLYCEKDDRVKRLDNETNKGLIYTRNRGLQNATGEYIANLDSDDVAMPYRLEKQVIFLKENQEYILLGGACTHIDGKGNKLEEVERNIPNHHLKCLLFFSNYFINSTVMFRGSIIKELSYQQGFAPAEDYELFCQIAELGEVANLPEKLVNYRIHDNNISSLQRENQLQSVRNILDNQLKLLGIAATKEELILHASLVSGPYNSAELSVIETWLLKLVEQNNKVQKYPEEIFNYYCAFFFRRAYEKSNLGIKSIKGFRNSTLSQYITNDFKGNVTFYLKSILKKIV